MIRPCKIFRFCLFFAAWFWLPIVVRLSAAQGQSVAITGATVHPVSCPPIRNATILSSGGKITAVGANFAVTSGMRSIPVHGATIFPGLIDAARRNTTQIDAKNNIKSTTFDALSRRTTMIDSGGTTTFAYTDRSELNQKSLPGGYVLSMSYDAVGNRTLLIDPDSGRFTTTFDSLNRTSVVKDPDNKLTTLQYDADSRRTTLIDANGATRKYAYDSASRLATQMELHSNNNPIITMIDPYESVGNRNGRTKDGTVTTWTHDDAYGLLGQQVSGSYATFSYDAAGNTLVKWQQGINPLTMSYDAANRLNTMAQGSTITTFTSDNTGNLTEENAAGSRTSYVYDNENRLVTAIFASGGRSSYTYDGDGPRQSVFEAGGSLEAASRIRTVLLEGKIFFEDPTGVRYVRAETIPSTSSTKVEMVQMRTQGAR